VLRAPITLEDYETLLERVLEAMIRMRFKARFGTKAHERVVAHRETDPTRRQDPDGVDMNQFRREIAQALG
jgi:hypothetical protein